MYGNGIGSSSVTFSMDVAGSEGIFLYSMKNILNEFHKSRGAVSKALSCVKRMKLKHSNTVWVAHILELLRPILDLVVL